jgi:hypothetical protein
VIGDGIGLLIFGAFVGLFALWLRYLGRPYPGERKPSDPFMRGRAKGAIWFERSAFVLAGVLIALGSVLLVVGAVI